MSRWPKQMPKFPSLPTDLERSRGTFSPVLNKECPLVGPRRNSFIGATMSSLLTLNAFRDRLSSFRSLRLSKTRHGLALRLLPSIAAAIIGIAMTATAGYVVSRGEERNEKFAFDVAAENRTRVLQAGLNEYLTKLGASQAIFNSVDDKITRREFENYAERDLEIQPVYSDAVLVAPRSARERARHELAAVRDGIPDYHIQNRATDGGFIQPDGRTNISRFCFQRCRRRPRSTALI